MITKYANEFFKTEYEKMLGEKISDATWYRVKALIKRNELEINLDVLAIIAKIKTKKLNIDLNKAVTCYLEFNTKLGRFRGGDIFQNLKSITGDKCADKTIIRWFRYTPLKQFKVNYIYNKSDIFWLYLKAYSYKAKYEAKVIKKSYSIKSRTIDNCLNSLKEILEANTKYLDLVNAINAVFMPIKANDCSDIVKLRANIFRSLHCSKNTNCKDTKKRLSAIIQKFEKEHSN